MISLPEKLQAYMPLFKQIFRFGIVGVTAASVHFCVVMYCVQVWLYVPLIANIFGFIVSFQVGYWGHRHWTFGDTITSHREFLRE
jgi:putative flippase GtrA